ncbi:MAG: hypothetical protein KY434_09995 [Actinobacteria bacterium]|nr:hypothetical protein [Actinomycetota bacterium]
MPGADDREAALSDALADAHPADVAGERDLTLADLAERTGISLVVLEALQREGILVPRNDSSAPWTQADADAVSAGLMLLEAGVPLSELLALAREHDEAMRQIAERAVDLFARYVKDPIVGSEADPGVVAERMVGALQAMLPAASEVVAHHFRRRVIQAARARMSS